MSCLLYFIPICSQRHCDIESHNIILQSTIMNMMLVFFKTKINILAKKCIKSKLNVFLSSEAFTECSCKYPHQLHTKTTCLWKHAWYKIRYHINQRKSLKCIPIIDQQQIIPDLYSGKKYSTMKNSTGQYLPLYQCLSNINCCSITGA